MAEDKKSFLLYTDLIYTVNKMPDDKAGELFKHILAYVNDLNPETDDLIIQLTFEPIKQQLKRDLLKYKETILDKSNAGKLGNLKRWNNDLYLKVINKEIDLENAIKIAEDRKLSHSDKVLSQPIAKIAVNDNVNVTVNDNVKENKISLSNKLDIKDRKINFATSLKPYVEIYGKELMNEFFEYWTEHGPNDKKMRYEKQTSFDVNLRLKKWSKNKNQNKTLNYGKPTRTDEQRNAVEDFKQRLISSINQ